MTFLLLVLLAAGPKVAPPGPPQASISRIDVALPDAGHAVLQLQARGRTGPLAPLASHRLEIGGMPLPLSGAPDVALTEDGFEARVSLDLAAIPEAVLELDPHALDVRYRAEDAKGNAVVQAHGTLDFADPGEVSLPVQRIYELYVRLDRWSLRPSLADVSFSALLSLENPFAFPLTIRRVEYSVTSGETPLFAGSRPGFRLYPRRRSDVLLEQTVPLVALGGAVDALATGKPLALRGHLILATPKGDQIVPFLLGTGP